MSSGGTWAYATLSAVGAGPRRLLPLSRHEHPLLHLQRQAGNGAVAALVQRRAPKRPAGSGGGAPFSPKVTRFGDQVIPSVRSALGLEAGGEWDDAARTALRVLQEEAGAGVTGVLDDERTLRWVVNLMTSGRRATANTKVGACWLLADWFGMPVRAKTTFVYEASLDSPGAIDPWSYEQRRARNGKGPMPPARIIFGPAAFDKNFAGLVQTIRHELFHDEQHLRKVPKEVKATDPTQLGHRDEFEAEWLEMVGSSLPAETEAGFADDAGRAIREWEQMTEANRKAMRPKFKAMLAAVEARLGESTDPRHQNIVRRWRDPVPAPPEVVRDRGPKEILIHGAETEPEHHQGE